MKEKNFQVKFSRWLKHNFKGTFKFELKLTKGKSLPFSAVSEHQVDALKAKVLVYKIPDVGQDIKIISLRLDYTEVE